MPSFQLYLYNHLLNASPYNDATAIEPNPAAIPNMTIHIPGIILSPKLMLFPPTNPTFHANAYEK